ncbi:MAG TPA: MBL fold metallo-hydrolase [Candidatus Pullichristensenella avicola]|nr:MBL fold metallo-hydrolase [Candidatus Pullichristensenella avicola]
MRMEFLGAAHEVTGSQTLLTVNGRSFLVDCGMEQGVNRFENKPSPVAAKDLLCAMVTHAHIDHSGNLPLLYRQGFRGPIYATEETCALLQIMLRDSAHIQVSEAEWKNRKAQRAGGPAVEPVYDLDDAEGALGLLRPCRYGERLPVLEGVEVRFADVGHLLGSAAVELWLREGETERKVVFSGDVGNTSQPLLRDPQRVESADVLVIESTYGDRLHEKVRLDYPRALAEVLQRTFDRGGNVVVPSFAVGRTQEMLYFLRQIKLENLVHGHDGFPVYVDSPLANEATAVFLQANTDSLDEEARALIREGVNPLWFDGLKTSVTAEESKQINFDKTPKVILSASGMCEAGRIRHHLKHNLWRRESTILFVGYQAEGTLGRQIVEGAKKVKLFGEEIGVAAEVRVLPGVSGHADRDGLLAWLEGFAQKPGRVFVNHGDDASCTAFTDTLRGLGYDARAPYSGAIYDIGADAVVEWPEGVVALKAKARAKSNVFARLLEAVNRLMRVARGCEGMANKELAKFESQINRLADEWER